MAITELTKKRAIYADHMMLCVRIMAICPESPVIIFLVRIREAIIDSRRYGRGYAYTSNAV